MTRVGRRPLLCVGAGRAPRLYYYTPLLRRFKGNPAPDGSGVESGQKIRAAHEGMKRTRPERRGAEQAHPCVRQIRRR
jgi:hypothetical protein